MAKHARFLGLLLAAAMFVGCQSPAKYQVWIEQLEKELRFQEDYIYELEYELEKLESELADRRGGKPPRVKLEEVPTPSPSGRSTFSPSSTEVGTPYELDIELPSAALPSGEAPRRLQAYEAPHGEPTPAVPPESPALFDPPPARPLMPEPVTDFELATLEFSEAECVGINDDGRSGDDALFIKLVGRNAAGQPLPLIEPISLAVWETAQEASGSARRLGVWHFSAGDVEQRSLLAAPDFGPAFELRWPGNAPRNSKLLVFARITTETGNELQVDHEFQVRLPGDPDDRFARRETPRNPSRNAEPQPTLAERLEPIAQAQPASADDHVDTSPDARHLDPLPRIADTPIGTGVVPPRVLPEGIPVRRLEPTPLQEEPPVSEQAVTAKETGKTSALRAETIGPPPATIYDSSERRTVGGRPVWRPER